MSNEEDERHRQAERLDALGRVAGAVAHDFNNLLTVIVSYASMLKEMPPTDAEALRADLGQIDEAARQAVEITSHLLTFGRRHGQRPMALDLGAYLRSHTADVIAALNGRASFEMSVAEDIGSVRLDPVHAGRVLKELAKNASEQLPQGGGTFWLEAKPVALDEAWVASHPGAVAGPHTRLSFRDSGPGFSPAARLRVFEPFFTTKPRGQGSGLGLATVYGIVRQSGGTIWLEGDTIAAYLPRLEA